MEIMCLEASGKWEQEDASLFGLHKPVPISEDVPYEHFVLWSANLSSPLCFLSGHQIFHWLSNVEQSLTWRL